MSFLDVLGNVGGVLGFFIPIIWFLVQPIAEHWFLIKFVKMAFITRQDEDNEIKHKTIELDLWH